MAELKKEGYLNELYDIRLKLLKFVSFLKNGESKYTKELAVKLRLLYSNVNNVSKGGKKQSLFKIISDLYNIEIKVLTKTVNTIDSLKKLNIPLPLLTFSSSIATWFETGNNLENIESAIKKESIYFKGESYTFDDIFRILSDKFGGCHIDKFINDNFIELYDFINIGGQKILIKSIFDLANASIEIINQIQKLLEEDIESKFIKKSISK